MSSMFFCTSQIVHYVNYRVICITHKYNFMVLLLKTFQRFSYITYQMNFKLLNMMCTVSVILLLLPFSFLSLYSLCHTFLSSSSHCFYFPRYMALLSTHGFGWDTPQSGLLLSAFTSISFSLSWSLELSPNIFSLLRCFDHLLSHLPHPISL